MSSNETAKADAQAPAKTDAADVNRVAGTTPNDTEPAVTAGADSEFNLKSVRKQDGPAHSAPGGHIHGAPEEHVTKE